MPLSVEITAMHAQLLLTSTRRLWSSAVVLKLFLCLCPLRMPNRVRVPNRVHQNAKSGSSTFALCVIVLLDVAN